MLIERADWWRHTHLDERKRKRFYSYLSEFKKKGFSIFLVVWDSFYHYSIVKRERVVLEQVPESIVIVFLKKMKIAMQLCPFFLKQKNQRYILCILELWVFLSLQLISHLSSLISHHFGKGIWIFLKILFFPLQNPFPISNFKFPVKIEQGGGMEICFWTRYKRKWWHCIVDILGFALTRDIKRINAIPMILFWLLFNWTGLEPPSLQYYSFILPSHQRAKVGKFAYDPFFPFFFSYSPKKSWDWDFKDFKEKKTINRNTLLSIQFSFCILQSWSLPLSFFFSRPMWDWLRFHLYPLYPFDPPPLPLPPPIPFS